MLAKRKLEFDEFEIYEAQPTQDQAAISIPQVDRKLRKRCFILIAVFAALAMFTTIRSEMIVSKGYALVQVKSQATQLESENERLKLENAKLKSPQRIKNMAMSNLGMIVPEEVYFASQSGN